MLTLVPSIGILLKTYRKTRFPSHAYLTISIVFFLLNSITQLLMTSFLATTDEDGAKLIWSIMNGFLIVAILFIFFAFMYVRYNRNHPATNVVSLFAGALILILVLPEFKTVTYDPTMQVWLSSYPPIVTLLILPMAIIGIGSFVVPIMRKLIRFKDRKVRRQLLVQTAGLCVLIIWAAFTGFTSNPILRTIRPFLLPIGCLIWSMTLIIDPFNVMVSNARLTSLIITTRNGLPIYGYDFEAKKDIESMEISGLLSGVTSALEAISSKMTNDQAVLSEVAYKDKVMGVTAVGFLTAYVNGERFDRTLKVVLLYLLKIIQDDVLLQSSIKKDSVALTPADEQHLTTLITSSLARVLVL